MAGSSKRAEGRGQRAEGEQIVVSEWLSFICRWCSGLNSCPLSVVRCPLAEGDGCEWRTSCCLG